MVKLVRVRMLGPVVLGLALVTSRLRDKPGDTASGLTPEPRPKGKRPSLGELVPWFIVGFLLVAAARSLGLVPEALLVPLAKTAGVLTTISMAALGLGVNLKVVARAGGRVTLAVCASLVTLGLISFALIRGLGVA